MTQAPDFSHLPAPAASLAAALSRPKAVAIGCVVVLAALGWLTLAWLSAGMGGAGSGLVALLPDWLQALCQPSFGSHAPGAIVLAMWGAMTLAMMLPTAGPMILTYAEIAETAAKKGERIVSPLLLAGGYGLVWAGFAVAASLAQLALTRAALIDHTMASASGLFSGAIFLAAGIYQFTPLKHACLTQCQRPFPFFFAHWQTTPTGVFKLGLQQGLYCLGCCWAMMLVMFAVGSMNVVWMAGLGIVMAIEKIGTGRTFSHIVGAGLIIGGLAFLFTAFAAHWPGGAGLS
jgi:predicted metal-binding membrane protein